MAPPIIAPDTAPLPALLCAKLSVGVTAVATPRRNNKARQYFIWSVLFDDRAIRAFGSERREEHMTGHIGSSPRNDSKRKQRTSPSWRANARHSGPASERRMEQR